MISFFLATFGESRFSTMNTHGSNTILIRDRKHCDPSCEFFRCEQKAINKRGNLIFCRWGEDECRGPLCNYASCTRGKMLANGLCGLAVRRRTRGIDEEELEQIEGIKIGGKLSKRLGDKEVF